MEYAFSAGLCLLELFSFSLAADAVFPRRFSNAHFHYICVAAFGAFLSACLMLFFQKAPDFVKLPFTLTIIFLMASVLYRAKVFARMLAVAICFLLWYAVDNIVMMAAMWMFHNTYSSLVMQKSVYIFAGFTAKTIMLLLVTLFGVILEKKNGELRFGKLRMSSWFLLFFIAMFSIFIMVLMVNQAIKRNELSVWVLVLCLGLWACDVAVIFLWNRLEKEGEIAVENKLLRKEIQSNLEKASALEQAYRRQRQQTHDFNNHMKAVQGLLTMGKAEEALQYVRQWTKEEAPGQMAIESGNPLVDTVLTQKYLQAKEKGVHMMVLLEEVATLPVSNAEFITVLTNLLDNAVRAAAECAQEKEVRVKLKHLADGGCLLSVRNTSNPVVIEQGNIQTTKQDAHAHGFGIANVKRVVEKYGGTCSLSQKDGWVQFTVLFPASHKIS